MPAISKMPVVIRNESYTRRRRKMDKEQGLQIFSHLPKRYLPAHPLLAGLGAGLDTSALNHAAKESEPVFLKPSRQTPRLRNPNLPHDQDNKITFLFYNEKYSIVINSQLR